MSANEWGQANDVFVLNGVAVGAELLNCGVHVPGVEEHDHIEDQSESAELLERQWFEDKETGKSLQRPVFEALQQAVFQGTIKTVVVWKLDRVSRRQLDGISVLADWCERGVRVVFVTQQIDLRGAVGRTFAAVLFGIAEIELEYRRERQAAGIQVAKKRGVYQGRKKGTTKATPAWALELRDRGLTAAEIASALGVSPRTVFRYLAAE